MVVLLENGADVNAVGGDKAVMLERRREWENLIDNPLGLINERGTFWYLKALHLVFGDWFRRIHLLEDIIQLVGEDSAPDDVEGDIKERGTLWYFDTPLRITEEERRRHSPAKNKNLEEIIEAD